MKIAFTGAQMDRADLLRQDPAALAAAMASPFSRVLRLHGLDPEVTPEGTVNVTCSRSQSVVAAPVALSANDVPPFSTCSLPPAAPLK